MSGINIAALSSLKPTRGKTHKAFSGEGNKISQNKPSSEITESLRPQKAQSILSVGNGVILKGKIFEAGQIIIHGSVRADINAVSITVESDGFLEGSVKTCELSISGNFKGLAEVTGALNLQNGGSFEGDVTYSSIKVEQGAIISGTLTIARDKTNSEFIDHSMPNLPPKKSKI